MIGFLWHLPGQVLLQGTPDVAREPRFRSPSLVNHCTVDVWSIWLIFSLFLPELYANTIYIYYIIYVMYIYISIHVYYGFFLFWHES